ncbi:PTS transporter subunit EIIC [Anoxybacillus sp. UARK-01]|uniref:PTS transporter subunit EIIC n=1 Tax=Anoxybacillus sp. UARK-01 TaxID=1895648 RepID=UPI0013748194|nr:PTS transporter subunit EIIC [Anoxybacillus sp. UARK-01]
MRKLGQLLSAMIYQNISVIIAVGIIREIFGIYGYFYNDRILLLVNPIYQTLLPILLAYTGGRLLGGQRGAVVASIVTYGFTLASSVPIIIGAMLIGPLVGWMIDRIERNIKHKIPIGYELLILNTLTAMLGIVLTIICFLYVGQALSAVIKSVNDLMQAVISSGWLPLSAVLIEPGKVLFFNNVINYGILGPLGIQQAKEIGKSIFFLLESNPGPGLGILLAYWLKTKKEKRRAVQLSILIHFLGGIHEIYFPYVLRNWKLIFAVIGGGIAGNIIFQLFDAGLSSLPSPGSMVTIIGMSPPDDILFVLLGVLGSVFVSLFLAFILLDSSSSDAPEQEYQKQLETIKTLQDLDKFSKIQKLATPQTSMKVPEKNIEAKEFYQPIHSIVFVCEAGMGSSAVGAAMLRKKLKMAQLDIEVNNASLQDIPKHADLIICHQTFLKDVQEAVPEKLYYSLQSFTSFHEYEDLVERIKNSYKETYQ